MISAFRPVLLVLCFMGFAPDLQAATLLGVRGGVNDDVSRLVLDLSAPIDPKVSLSSDGRSLMIVMQGSRGRVPRVVAIERGLIDLARNRTSGLDGLEITLSLTEPAQIVRQFALSPVDGRPQRYVVDLTAAPNPSPPDPAPIDPKEDDATSKGAENVDAAPEADIDRASAEGSTSSPADRAIPGSTAPSGFGPPGGFAPSGTFGAPMDDVTLDDFDARESGPFDFSLAVEGELRIFPQASQPPGLGRASGSVALRPRAVYDLGERHQFVLSPFFRLDSSDPSRTHFDIGEAKYVGSYGPVELRVGFDRLFWGVVESFHLVDIINQDDQLEDLDQEDRLGQFMIRLAYAGDFGRITGFVLPTFRQRRFAGVGGRPGFGVTVNRDLASFEAASGDEHIDFAFRYDVSTGPLDLGIAYFDGTARDPTFIPVPDPGSPTGLQLAPRYELIRQTSIDAQLTRGALLLKLEALYQFDNEFEDFFALATGFEYSFFDFFGSGADFGILSEFLYDSRGVNTPFSAFENDLFLGFRYTVNDTQDTNILGGVIVDLDSGGSFANLELSRRLGSDWSLTADARLFLGIEDIDPLAPFANDDFIQIRLTRFF